MDRGGEEKEKKDLELDSRMSNMVVKQTLKQTQKKAETVRWATCSGWD